MSIFGVIHSELAVEWPPAAWNEWSSRIIRDAALDGAEAVHAYRLLDELSDTLHSWREDPARMPGQVWVRSDLSAARHRFAHLLPAMRRHHGVLPARPGWLTMQLVDLLTDSPGLPSHSEREIDRRQRYHQLHAAAERIHVTAEWSVELALFGPEPGDEERQPELPDELTTAAEQVRPRDLAEIVSDLNEEVARSSLPDRVVPHLRAAAALLAMDRAEEYAGAAVAELNAAKESLLEEIGNLGDFRISLP